MPDSSLKRAISSIINSPLAAPVGIVLILTAIFANHLIHGYTLAMVGMEGSSQWNPFWTFARNEMARGHFPLWTPNSMGGWSMPGFPHTALFYPLSFFFYLMPYEKATTYNTLMHLIISALLMYRFLRGIKSSRYAAFIGSLLWSTGGFYFVFCTFLPLLWTITWTPLFFDCARRWLVEGRARQLMLLALVAAIQFLGGSVESLVYEIMALWLFIIVLAPGSIRRGESRPEAGCSPIQIRGRLLSLALVMGIVAAISAIELLPAMEQSSQSVRSLGLSYKYFAERGFHLSWWISFLIPVSQYGSNTSANWFLPGYMGLIAPLFSIYAIIFRSRFREANVRIGILTIFYALFAARDLPVFGRFLYQIPILDSLREPAYGLFIPQFLIIALAARGIDNLGRLINGEYGSDGDKKSIPNQTRNAYIYFVIFPVILGILQIISPLFHYWERNILALFIFVMIIVAYLLHSRRWTRIKHFLFSGLFGLFLLDNLALAPIILPQSKHGYLNLDSEYMKFLSPKPPYERHQVLDKYGVRSAELPPHAGMIINTQTLDGWEGTPNLRYSMFLNLLDDRALVFKDGKLDGVGHHRVFREGKFVDPDKLPFLNLAGVKYLVTRDFPLKMSSPFSLVNAEKSFKIKPGREFVCYGRDCGKCGENSIWMKSGAIASIPLYLTDGDSLVFQLQREGDLNESVFEITIRQNSSQSETTIFSKFVRELSNQTSEKLHFKLDQWFGQTIDMEFRLKGRSNGDLAVIEPEIVNDKKLFQRIFHNEIDIYNNPDAFPRAFYLHRIAPVSSPQAAIAWMKDHASDLRNVAPVEGFSMRPPQPQILGSVPDNSAKSEQVLFNVYKADNVLLEANPLASGYLVLTDAWYPGWEAKIDGMTARIYPAYCAFRAVFVPNPGINRHLIEFIYKPVTFKIGLWMTMSSLVMWLAGMAFVLRIQLGRNS